MELNSILEKTLTITRQTGEFIQRERKRFTTASIEYKGKNDLVSYVDKESEKMLVAGLKDIVPEAGFITEEGTTTIGRRERYNWVIDPVDGTTNFVHGLPVYCISIALMEHDKVILGIIHDPTRNETFYSALGGKAYCDEQEIKVSDATSLTDSLIATGFPYHSFHRIGVYLDMFKFFMKETHGLRRMGSAAIDLAYVACGRFEGFFEFNLKPWDVAAGAFLIEQAGGKVSNFKGENDYIFKGQIIGACNLVHPEMLHHIHNFWESQT